MGSIPTPGSTKALFRALWTDDESPKMGSVATLALQAGVHPKVVQEQLGHSGINVTLDIYSHVPQAVRRESATKIASLFGSTG